ANRLYTNPRTGRISGRRFRQNRHAVEAVRGIEEPAARVRANLEDHIRHELDLVRLAGPQNRVLAERIARRLAPIIAQDARDMVANDGGLPVPVASQRALRY